MAQAGIEHTHGGLREEIVLALRQDIISGRLAPGEALRTEPVMERFGVSNSPLREALAQLSAEGLVVVSRNRGAVVSPLDRATAADVLRVSGLLLEHVVRWSLVRLVPGDVAVMRRVESDFDLAYRSGDLASAYLAADRFRECLLERCGSPELVRALMAVLPRRQRLVRLLDPVEYLAWQGSLQEELLAAATGPDLDRGLAALQAVGRQIARAVDALPDDVLGA
ncbi:MAG TPA: GntR family transcriptional regulator [Candidatus Nanopelagicales bacterium]|jgi:DNA-binding GntR family transcriptional regulator|nr:GntR family transcriptional regulator [Candidatus Nanopelagicales bacterium]